MTWKIHALSAAPFRPLFDLDDGALARRGVRRMAADAPHSAPCRISLVDAQPGETLLLVNHVHLPSPASPYRANGPIFVRQGAARAALAPGSVPDMLARRLLSARVYDGAAMMIDADVEDGACIGARLDSWFTNPDVHRIQLHTARRGCFMAEALRVSG